MATYLDGLISTRRIDEGAHEVLACDGECIGVVYRDDSAWSYGQWFIQGARVEHTTPYSRHGTKKKPHGARSMKDAAEYLAKRQSSILIRKMP